MQRMEKASAYKVTMDKQRQSTRKTLYCSCHAFSLQLTICKKSAPSFQHLHQLESILLTEQDAHKNPITMF